MKARIEKSSTLGGKKVVVIGGSSGIGLAVAQAASAKKAEIIIVSSNQERINIALQSLPQDSLGYAIDVTNETQVQQLFEKTGKFDHLVFTAGENLVNGEISGVKMEN